MRFKGKVVIVTGGSKGIGEGCARVFCREGGLVSILARGPEAGKKLAEELTAQGPGKAIFIPCDVGQHLQLKEAIEIPYRLSGDSTASSTMPGNIRQR